MTRPCLSSTGKCEEHLKTACNLPRCPKEGPSSSCYLDQPFYCAVSAACSPLLTSGDRAHLAILEAKTLKLQDRQRSEKLQWLNALQAGAP